MSSVGTRQTMLDLFAEQVRARPGAIATSSELADLTYGQLDDHGDRVAAWLARHGIGPDDVVAVEMNRGCDLVVALLGVLKAGAAYLALEPDTPRPRRDAMVADAAAAALITNTGGIDRPGLVILRLPDDTLPDAGPAPAGTVRPLSLAYLCYTSGSTGRPKRVGVPHEAVARLVRGDDVDLGPDQTFLFQSPVSFDASTFEIWVPLLTGGTVVTYPPGPVLPEELIGLLREEKITTMFLTTALFHRMVDNHLDGLGGLHQLLTGGEPLDPGHINRFLERFPGTRLIAAYGPTENTSMSSYHTVRTPVRTRWVPLGDPVAGTTMRVLDTDLRPVLAGCPGELWISGIGLAWGYLGQPVATALSFVPDPFGPPGSRIYRSGDLVRPDVAGELEFIGRRDRQVKIRGFRVEPGEVEREMTAVAGVRQAIIEVHGDRHEQKRMTAYLVPDPDDDDRAELPARVRRSLRGTLPAAMIPMAFIMMDEFPLNPNGKVDRAALPVPDRSARTAETDYVAPRSPTEQLLCDIWAESLKLDSIGAVDDFFDLGGNSLLAMDLISRTEIVFNVELPVRLLLYNPTVEEFAGAIDRLVESGPR